ncbi:MAG: hypothetical protein ABSG24_11290 [Acidimicrobiales bacterium]
MTMTFWEGIDHAIAYDESRIPEPNADTECRQLESMQAKAATLLSEELSLGNDLKKLKDDISTRLTPGLATFQQDMAGLSGAINRINDVIMARNHIEGWNSALADLRADLGLSTRYLDQNQALVANIRHAQDLIEGFMMLKCRPKPIQAVFTQALYHTVYTVPVYDPDWSYDWSVSIPKDPRCASGFKENTPFLNKATWYHADVDIGGPCLHLAGDYGARGHPGTVTVIVSSSKFVCTLTYYGTITGEGGAPSCKVK